MATTPLNPFQRRVAETYGGGDFEHFALNPGELEECGDTLFVFLMRELEDVTDLEEAARRLDTALADVAGAREALFDHPLKKAVVEARTRSEP